MDRILLAIEHQKYIIKMKKEIERILNKIINNVSNVSKIEKICKECGKKFEVYLSSKNASIYCSNTCCWKNKEWLSKIGNKKEFIGTPHQITRLAQKIMGIKILGIKEHIKIPCFDCRKKEKGIQVHHIDRNRLNNEKKNLVILCNSCHQKRHYQEDKNSCKNCGKLLRKDKLNHSCKRN